MLETIRPGVIIVGTAHVSPTSVADVERTIRQERPQRVLVELDPLRLHALRDPDGWLNTDILRVIKDGKQYLFLLQIYLAAMQARIGRDTGVAPGTELLRAVEVAEEVGAEVILIDRDVSITLKRGFGAMGFWAKLRLFWKVIEAALIPAAAAEHAGPKDAAAAVEALLETDAITQMTEEFAKFAPVVKTALIDERDTFMASHIAEQAARGSVVAVVGAGHMAGIKKHLADGNPLATRASLLELPKKGITVGKVVAIGIPLALAIFVGYLLVTGDTDRVVGAAWAWIILHVLLAGLGGALALGHPLAILTGAATASITSFLPVGVKSGWLAGFVQAKMRTPKVRDFQEIKTLETAGQFWRNGVVRVLTVTGLTNLGSMLASAIVTFGLFAGGL